MAYLARNFESVRQERGSTSGNFSRSGFPSVRDPSPSRSIPPSGRDRGGLLVPLNIRTNQSTVNEDKNKWNGSFTSVDTKIGTRGGKSAYEDSQRTTLGQNSFAIDSQMTCADQPSSYGSQNCSYNDSQASIPTEEMIPSQHRLQNISTSQSSGQRMRAGDKFDPPSSSRAQTPVSGVGARTLLQEHRPPKAPTWNSTLIKRSASPVFEAMRNLDTAVSSPRSSISTPPSLDTIVSLLRTSNVEPIVRDLAKEIEGRFDLLRSQIKEGHDEGRIQELIQDQERNILEAVRQTEQALKAIQNYQVQIGESISRIESKIDDNTSQLSDWIETQRNSGSSNFFQHSEFNNRNDQKMQPMLEEENSFDIFQDIGSRARILADKRISKIQQKVEAKRRRIQAL